MRNSLLQITGFVRDIAQARQIIWMMAVQDIRTRYLGSYLGVLWAFIQPTVTILIFWFVFEVGFKAAPVNNIPFVLWLVAGMIPWFLVSEGLSGATGAILDNRYLVNKVVFRVSLLPVIRILSALSIHLFFLVFTTAMFACYNYRPDWHLLQLGYYLTAALLLVLGLAWITSALVIFYRDVGQVIAMLLQFGFWLTPIFWPISTIPPHYQKIVKLNPFYYIIEGYRASFLGQGWFWEDTGQMVYYWFITAVIVFAGVLMFRRLRPHFADVL